MTEVIELARDWKLFLLGLLVFGLAPGVVLRLLVLAYPKGHPRREELVGELYVIGFIVRPFWVAQQLETALFEGLKARWERRRHHRWEGRRNLGGWRPERAVVVALLFATPAIFLAVAVHPVWGPVGYVATLGPLWFLVHRLLTGADPHYPR